jgi:hypothetical protein
LSLPYQTSYISYKERLITIGIIPICYWHEYLDLVYLYKCIISNSDRNIIKTPARETRNTNATNGILLEVAKCKTVSYQNSFYVRVANVWNTLPYSIREANKTLAFFKFCLMKHYNNLTKEIYNPEDPRTFKSVCVKCHTTRHWVTCSIDHVVKFIHVCSVCM